MNSFINTLSDTVLSRKFESFDLEELKTLSQTYPYASSIQLLYAQKLKKSGNAGYHEQLQKTLLYYGNPLFIKHLIENEERIPVAATAHTSVNEPPGEALAPAEISVAEQPSAEAVIDTSYPDGSEEMPIAEKISSTEEELQPAMELTTNNERNAEVDADTETVDADDEASLPPLPEFKFEPIDPSKAELSFTPYHTIDYFAAQGIKLGDDQQSGDRFGTQLKSFTAWLKQMKRLPGATAKGNISLTEEKSIEQMAEQSLKGENADTEAMAQVWAKQGNSKKAIDIYKKLSLQIPAKSAYFAAKIDHLKK